MATDPISFIHLSDIHFRYGTSNTPYDLDDVIRNELVIDAKEEVTKAQISVYGILISGDIAFSGIKAEYDIAYDWLDKLCKATSCSLNRIWTVPGNHDIDRRKIENNRSAERLRATLRQTPLNQLDDEIRASLEDAQDRQFLFEPLEEYNVFASKFGRCSTSRPLYWEDNIPLNDGSILRLRGLNSILISDRHDSAKEEQTKLILSSFQTKFIREDGVVYLTMCHHPLDWLRDGDDVEGWLDVHARVQLFGHRHQHRVRPIADNIRIASGAMHPERGEPGWEPRYNLINLEVIRNEAGRWLHVEVTPRVWNDIGKKFVLDGLGIYTRDLPLGDWQPAMAPTIVESPELTGREELSVIVAAIKSDLLDLAEKQPRQEVNILNAAEILTSRYLSLPRTVQRKIARKLDLIEDKDQELSEPELYKRYFHRAKERKLLERLWEEIGIIYVGLTDEQTTENPFVGS